MTRDHNDLMPDNEDVNAGFPPYPAGLRLAGRRVLVVGGGRVAQRRIPGLLAAGAAVEVVSPRTTPAVEGYVGSGQVSWHRRGFEPTDVDGAWYVVAATDDTAVNEAVSAAAEAQRVFCVRADDAPRATAWTPAVGRHAGVTVAVLGNREPRRSAAVRDAVVAGLRDGLIAAPQDQEKTPGVVLVGGGPGAPELVTVAARRALSEADVVVADRLAPRALLDELSPDVELVDVAKLPRGRSASQEEINRVIVERAQAGKRVVRFKGGDSFVYGRGFEEALACEAAGVAWTVIPGITSAISVPAAVGIPVTHRGVAHEFTVISGHLPPGHESSLVDWDAAGRLRGTLVLLMAVENLPAISARLVGRRTCPPTPPWRSSPRAPSRGSARCFDPGPRGRRRVARAGAPARRRRGRRGGRGGASGALLRAGGGMAQLIEVADPRDPRLADYRDLRDVELRKHLEAEHGLFLAEGEKVVRRAVEAGFPTRSFLMAPRWLEGLADVLDRTEAPCYVVSERLAEEVTGFHVHRGALASLERLPLPAVADLLAEARTVVVLEDVVDHTNVGAMFRSAAALGVDAVLLSPRCADPLYRRAVKVAMGAVFALPYARLEEWYDAMPDLAARRVHHRRAHARRGRAAAGGGGGGPRQGGPRGRHRGARPLAALATLGAATCGDPDAPGHRQPERRGRHGGGLLRDGPALSLQRQ